ncbi:thymidine kinase [Sphingobacteriales bacterium UPWRP_1]|nr:thymidine kinase [Sphingobacteriales bacterium TSM_CSM]PSJ75172.1 thymidine kinase [Sphingobacteriales bacterium UPWRP_1]
MFLEPQVKKGWIEVICGSMFSGKTEELIRRLRRAAIANQRVVICKPALDTRYDISNIVSHDASMLQSVPIAHSSEILELAATTGAEVVGIDEVQFFDEQLPQVCEQLALQGIRVILAGLDMDYLGKPFGTMPYLLSVAEYITKLHAICMVCGNLASHSYRKEANEEQVLLGAKDLYEPRCRICYHQHE